MDYKQAGLGVVLFLVYWSFQAGYFSGLGTTEWFLAVLIFVLVTWVIGKSVMPKPSADMKLLWNYTGAFALIVAILISYVPANVLGMVLPADFSLALYTPILLSIVLTLYGAAMFVTGWVMRWNITTAIGAFWLLDSLRLALVAGPNAYLHFGIVTGIPFILYGLLTRE